jgi:hypothetical protein
MAGVDRERGLKLGERCYVKRVVEEWLNDPLLTSSAKNLPLSSSSLAFVNVLAFKPFGLSPAALVAIGYQLGEGKGAVCLGARATTRKRFSAACAPSLDRLLPARPSGAKLRVCRRRRLPVRPARAPRKKNRPRPPNRRKRE